MSNPIDLFRQEFERRRYKNNINTSFTQFGVTPQAENIVLPTVSEFFQYYNELFFQIPKYGALDSHEYLIQQSSAYVGEQQQLEEIQALQNEISELRRQLLESRNDALNTIADVLDESGLNFPALPEIPNIEVPSEFNLNIPSDETQTSEEKQTKREKRKAKREERRKKREERKKQKEERRNN